jgi:hypothetical protein
MSYVMRKCRRGLESGGPAQDGHLVSVFPFHAAKYSRKYNSTSEP